MRGLITLFVAAVLLIAGGVLLRKQAPVVSLTLFVLAVCVAVFFALAIKGVL